jgi:hypothetical protein
MQATFATSVMQTPLALLHLPGRRWHYSEISLNIIRIDLVMPDLNGATQDGLGYVQVTQCNSRRCSASTAYTTPNQNQRNLTLEVGAQVAGLLFSGSRVIRATGSTVWHGSCPCAIGRGGGPGAARVRGRTAPRRRRLHHASVIRSHTNGPTVMIGEKGADLIRESTLPQVPSLAA